jgi:hypothetical protein
MTYVTVPEETQRACPFHGLSVKFAVFDVFPPQVESGRAVTGTVPLRRFELHAAAGLTVDVMRSMMSFWASTAKISRPFTYWQDHPHGTVARHAGFLASEATQLPILVSGVEAGAVAAGDVASAGAWVHTTAEGVVDPVVADQVATPIPTATSSTRATPVLSPNLEGI